MSEAVTERLSLVGPLQKGGHPSHDAMCIMEAVAFVAGEPWTDTPECACPVICAFMQSWNDELPDSKRDALLRPLIPCLIGTRATKDIEHRRAMMAADWLVRVHTPAWLRLAGLTAHADALTALPEITDMTQCPLLMPVLEAALTDADAAGAAAGAAAWDAARAAAGGAAWAAAWDAAGGAAWAAAWAAAWDAARAAAGGAARAAAWDAAWAAARVAAWDAAGAAAWAALNATRIELQQSALKLVERMIETTP